MTNQCRHSTLKIMGFNALGATVGCYHCDETFDLSAAKVEEDYYPFKYNSPRGEAHDILLLMHFKIIER